MNFSKINIFFTNFKNNKNEVNLFISYLLLFVTVCLLFVYQSYLIKLLEWGDEAETVLVTKMMASGLRLYTEIYNNHGPLIFFPGYIVSLLGNYSVWVYRIPIFILQWISLLSIYLSPVFKNKALRNYAVLIIATSMNIFLPHIYGHTYIYQVVSGYFAIIIIFILTLPSLSKILNPIFVDIVSGFLIVSLIFLAITNLPISILLLASSIRKFNWKSISIGLLIGIIFNLLFLFNYGSFNGYIAYHFYLNSNILYSGQGFWNYYETIINYYTKNYYNFLTLGFVILIVYKLNSINKEYIRNLLFIPMFMSLTLRGGASYSFAGLTYSIILFGLVAILFVDEESIIEIEFSLKNIVLIIFSIVCLTLLAAPQNNLGIYWELSTNSEFSRIAKTITNKEEKVLAFTFHSYEYILADRLPASAHFIYLPIQAEYNKNPYKDIYVNLVEDILNNRPKIILVDGWSTMEKENYDWYTYADDVMNVIYSNYYKLEDLPIYIRYDVNLFDYGLDPVTGRKIP